MNLLFDAKIFQRVLSSCGCNAREYLGYTMPFFSVKAFLPLGLAILLHNSGWCISVYLVKVTFSILLYIMLKVVV